MAALLFSFLSLLGAAIAIFMGAAVFFGNPKRAINRVYMLLCFSVSFWAFTEFEIRHSETYGHALFWQHIAIAFPFTCAILLHFCLLLTRRTRLLAKPYIYFIIYAPAFALAILHMTPWVTSDVVYEYWGWSYAPPDNWPEYMTTYMIAAVPIFSLGLCLYYLRKQTDYLKRKQMRFVSLGLAFPIVLGVLTEAFLPIAGRATPQLTTISFALITTFFIAYAMWKYELFDITPEKAASDILSTMSDSLVLTDSAGKIRHVNKAAREMLGYRDRELVGQGVDKVFAPGDKESIREIVLGCSAGVQAIDARLVGSDGSPIDVSASFSKLRDRNGDCQGSVCAFRNISERMAAEDKLKKSEAMLRAQYKSIPLATCTWKKENGGFTMIDYNDAAVAGWPEAVTEETARGISEFFNANEDIHGSLEECFRLRRNIRREITLTLPHVGEKTYDCSFAFVPPDLVLAHWDDITDRSLAQKKIRQQAEELTARNAELTALYGLSNAIGKQGDMDTLLANVLEAVAGATSLFDILPLSGVLLVEGKRMRLARVNGDDERFSTLHKEMKVGDCLCGLAARTGKIIVSTDSEHDERHTFHCDGEVHGHIILPLRARGATVGVLFMYQPAGAKGPDEHRLQLLSFIGFRIGMAIDNVRLYEKTRELSLHDPLTGLANRRMNSMELEKEFARSRRSGSPLSVIMFDLDKFKDYNDTYGHSAGDALLVNVANIIHDEIREIDLAVRYGGEEFLVLLPDTGLWAAKDVAERIRGRISATEFRSNGDRGGIDTHMTVSGGVASADDTADTADRLIDSADAAMYGAKQHGRDRIEASLARKTGWMLS